MKTTLRVTVTATRSATSPLTHTRHFPSRLNPKLRHRHHSFCQIITFDCILWWMHPLFLPSSSFIPFASLTVLCIWMQAYDARYSSRWQVSSMDRVKSSTVGRRLRLNLPNCSWSFHPWTEGSREPVPGLRQLLLPSCLGKKNVVEYALAPHSHLWLVFTTADGIQFQLIQYDPSAVQK